MKLHKANILRIIYFLFFCCTASWLPLLADYCKSRGLTGTQISLILSITPVLMFLVQPVVGFIADRVGYKKTLMFSAFFASISYLGYLYKADYAWLIGVTFFMALFYNGIQPVLDSIALRIADTDKRFSYGSLRVAGAVGWAITGIIAGQVIDSISFQQIFMVSFISMFLVFVFSFFLPRDSKEKTQEDFSFQYLRNVISNRQLLFLLLCVFLVSTSATTIWNFYSIYMKENGASATLVGLGLSFSGLCEIPFFYFSARIILRLGLKATLLITVLATAIRLVLYSAITDPVAAIPVEVLHGLSWSLFWVVCVESVNKMVDEKWRVTGQSLLYAAYFGAGAVAGNFWTGFLYDRNMKIADIFFLNSVIVLGVVILILFFFKRKEYVHAEFAD